MNQTFKPVLRRHASPNNRKPVKCIETGIIYNCVRDAADNLIENNIIANPEDIRKVCLGQRITAGGFKWKYVNDIVEDIARRNGDMIVKTDKLQPDHIHPSWAGYKELVEKTK